MRSIFFTILVMACILAAVLGSPAKDLKDIKKEAAKKKSCLQNCDSAKFAPICAGRAGSANISFGSVCVMNNYNCEHSDTVSKISEGECPGKTGIRLS